MALTEFFRHLTVKGKDVFIVDDHHNALAAWALVRRGLPAPPNLLTIDYHTDTNEAFRVHAHIATNGGHPAPSENRAGGFQVGKADGVLMQVDLESSEWAQCRLRNVAENSRCGRRARER